MPFNSINTEVYFHALISMNQNNEWCAWKELRDRKLEESLLGVTNPSVYDAKQSDIDAGVFLVEPSTYPALFSDSENEWEEDSTDLISELDNEGKEKTTSHQKSPSQTVHSPLQRSN